MTRYPRVEYVTECFIKPQCLPEESKELLHLTPWDLKFLSFHYIQKGLLFAKPPEREDSFMETLIEKLKTSLSIALSHFYPLAGRLKTTLQRRDPPSRVVYVDCRDSPGAKFIRATLDMTVSDILSQTYVPHVVQSLFDHHKAVNHDGHVKSLLSVQVTELADGVFIGCSMNHCLGDGTSYWNFLNSWSEIFGAQDGGRSTITSISRPPILRRWIPDRQGPIFSLPFSQPEDFIIRFEAPELRERIFHFSAESVAKLKAKANAECGSAPAPNEIISSFQSLSTLVWRCVTRARNPAPDRTTSCFLIANSRSRLDPQIPENYFGNPVYVLKATASARELLERGLGWAALRVHRAVAELSDEAVRESLDNFIRSPFVGQITGSSDPLCVKFASSPRFNMYGSEFGMGKALALRSGYANKHDGGVTSYPGRQGGGSVDLEVCLLPEAMHALESDDEFMEAAGLLHS